MVYRFFQYNNTFFKDKYLWCMEGSSDDSVVAYELMSSAAFIDALFTCYFETKEPWGKKPGDIIHIKLDDLQRDNIHLFYKTYKMIENFDDSQMTPVDIENWLSELRKWHDSY